MQGIQMTKNVVNFLLMKPGLRRHDNPLKFLLSVSWEGLGWLQTPRLMPQSRRLRPLIRYRLGDHAIGQQGEKEQIA